MIRELHEEDRQAILDLAYRRERENLFIIGSFQYPGVFEDNRYFGLEQDGALEGIAAFFGKWGSFVVCAPSRSEIDSLVDAVREAGCRFTTIPAFRRYAQPMLERLRKHHGCVPKKISEETVFLLTEEQFRSVESSAVVASESDREDCARFAYSDGSPAATVTGEELSRVIPADTLIIRENGVLVSKANIQGRSMHYAQIGGVGTLPKFRRKGYARQCVSALCAHCFRIGIPHVILYTANTNTPARKLYRSLGFMPVDDFLIVEYG